MDIDWSGIHWSGMSPGVELAFTDRAGVHRVRSADGSLLEISQPLEFYDLGLPTHWRSSSPA